MFWECIRCVAKIITTLQSVKYKENKIYLPLPTIEKRVFQAYNAL